MIQYPDAEDLVHDWLLTTSVAALVSNKVYLGMPEGFAEPKLTRPIITLSRVGGALDTSATPTDLPRISFKVWSPKRTVAKAIVRALVSEVDALGESGGFESESLGGKLQAAKVLMNLFLPEPISDTPRYVVDVTFAVTPLVGV